MTISLDRLSRLVSHALRHEPWRYELTLDKDGWVAIDALLTAVHEQGPQWSQVDRGDLVDMVASSVKQRHEIDGARIRARYGHSVPVWAARAEMSPPSRLYHGTSPQAWSAIQVDGLRPMGRQYVHLSTEVATAEQVGRRKSSSPVILTVKAAEAHAAGARFWRGNDLVWLADHVPARFVAPATAAERGSR